ncbi:hypothetical protein MNBD_PLANCTO03-1997 [hydrothermal vent metagenome]|uniref:Permease often clustered with de novo purine synthesis n=1 Tax=hydrothermal vent metagenome TaxID=652676 RepID=A0A3B1E0U8_9ZZZZ
MTKKPDADVAPESRPTPAKGKSDWMSLHLWQIQGVRDVLVFLAVLGVLWLGQKVSVVTVPLLLAILLAYLFEPVIGWVMQKTGLLRQKAVTLVMAAAILLVVIPAVLGLTLGVAQSVDLISGVSSKVGITGKAVVQGKEMQRLEAQLAAAVARATNPAKDEQPPTEAEIESLRQALALHEASYETELDAVEAEASKTYRGVAEFVVEKSELDDAFVAVQNWLKANAEEIATFGAGAVRSTAGFFGSLFGLLFMGFLTAFFFFFISTGWVQVKDFGTSLLPEKNREMVVDLATKFDGVISAFIRGRLTIAFIQSIIFTVGYFIIGVPAAFLLGPVVAVLSIVPYLALVGVPISIVLLASQGYGGFRGEWWWFLGAPTAIYFIGQALDDYVLTPKIQGKGTGMDTPTILFASLAGGVLFGIFGLLIAIPIAACLKILIQEVFWPRFKDWAEGREKDFLPIGRE